MSEFIQKGTFKLIGKTLRFNIEGKEYFALLSDVFLCLAGAEEEPRIYLHNVKPNSNIGA